MKLYSHLFCVVLGCLLLARGTVCDQPQDKCDTDCKAPVTEKEKYGRDISGGIAGILTGASLALRSGVFEDICDFATPAWGYLAGGLIDGVMGVKEMGKVQDKSAWVVHHIEVYLDTMREDLICEMKSIMGQTFDKYLAGEDLKNFNNEMNAMQTAWGLGCYSRSCLNETQRDPVIRSEGCCNPPIDTQISSCKTAMRKTPDKVRAGGVHCTTVDNIAGVCGSDRRCHVCHNWEDERSATEAFISQYKFNPSTAFGQSVQGYNGSDGFLAEAKAATFMIVLYQQMHLLGSKTILNEEMMEFANITYNSLKSRYDNMNSIKRIKELIENVSTPPFNVNKTSVVYSNSGKLLPVVEVHNQATARLRSSCKNNSDFYMIPTTEGCGNCTAENSCYCDVQSCPAAQKVPVMFCDGYRCDPNVPPNIAPMVMGECYNYMNLAWSPNVKDRACGKEGVTDRYELMFNDTLGRMSRQIFDATKNLSVILESFKNISEVGMPNNSFGYYPINSLYPNGTCPSLTGPK